MPLPRLVATRYVLPLREGGSLPAIVDTDAGRQYVVKFLGAGQGPKALVAEVIAAGLARALGLPMPEVAVIQLDEGFGYGEPNPEIQDLLRGSTGLNFGIAYLPGALGFDPVADYDRLDDDLAGAIVWFDALITNVDRTPRNANLLVWDPSTGLRTNGGVWLIDHGASLYFHHASNTGWTARAQDRFPLIEQHILLKRAPDLNTVHARLRPLLDEPAILSAVQDVPDEWLGEDAAALKQAYVRYLTERLSGPLGWLEEAESARRRA